MPVRVRSMEGLGVVLRVAMAWAFYLLAGKRETICRVAIFAASSYARSTVERTLDFDRLAGPKQYLASLV